MVRIRLTRTGRRNLAKWRVGVFDARTRRDGRPIEYLGHYDPHQEKDEDKIHVNVERAQYWLKQGAQPSRTVSSLLKKASVQV
ncbi:MAG: 30S ribosomal protein S16 [Candidatus Brocadiia bacterium]|jgi:small subunit ribosomal protein S16|nr:30S ribosomal protein S16 [Candidatus Brocadiia bacterium]